MGEASVHAGNEQKTLRRRKPTQRNGREPDGVSLLQRTPVFLWESLSALQSLMGPGFDRPS